MRKYVALGILCVSLLSSGCRAFWPHRGGPCPWCGHVHNAPVGVETVEYAHGGPVVYGAQPVVIHPGQHQVAPDGTLLIVPPVQQQPAPQTPKGTPPKKIARVRSSRIIGNLPSGEIVLVVSDDGSESQMQTPHAQTARHIIVEQPNRQPAAPVLVQPQPVEIVPAAPARKTTTRNVVVTIPQVSADDGQSAQKRIVVVPVVERH